MDNGGGGVAAGGRDGASYEDGRRVPGTGDIYYEDMDTYCEGRVDFCFQRDGGIAAYRDPLVRRANSYLAQVKQLARRTRSVGRMRAEELRRRSVAQCESRAMGRGERRGGEKRRGEERSEEK